MREPLPLPSLTAAAYAHAKLRTGDDPVAAAKQAWESNYNFDKEDREPEHQLVFSGELPAIEQLGAHAVALWAPLLERETVEEQ
jgi:exonuclease V gamma subunit